MFRRPTEAAGRKIANQAWVEIGPVPIFALDQIDLPVSLPLLHCLLTLDCRHSHRRTATHPDHSDTHVAIYPDAVRLGLLGELLVLRALMKSQGQSAANAWVGPNGEPHDFRFGAVELEVKSTTHTSRRHVINGLAQLQHSPGRRLYVLSLQFAPAGGSPGFTLPALVADLRAALKDHELAATLDRHLGSLGYRNEDSPFYAAPFQLRAPALLVEVDAALPRLTASVLEGAWGSSSDRISEVQYVLTLDGLGHPEGSDAYTQVLKNVRISLQ